MENTFLLIVSALMLAFFSGIEVAFGAANHSQFETNRKKGEFQASILQLFAHNPAIFHSSLIMGQVLSVIAFSLSVLGIFHAHFSPDQPMVQVILVAVLLIMGLGLSISLFTEGIVKPFTRQYANVIIIISSVPLLFVFTLSLPFTFLLGILTRGIRKVQVNQTDSADPYQVHFSKQNLVYLMQQNKLSDQNETTENENIRLFQNALDFSSVKIHECMVPRTEIVAIDKAASTQEIRDLFFQTGFSKILVYNETIDNIIGYVTAKSLFNKQINTTLPLIDISIVPETMPAQKLLTKFIQEKKGIAVIVDEFGGVSGMLTIEDILEEIFGEIEDEHDTTELVAKTISENEFVFSGRLEIDYLNEHFMLQIPESEEYDTLAGFVINAYQNIPGLNEVISIPPFEIKILNVSHTKVELVQLKRMG